VIYYASTNLIFSFFFFYEPPPLSNSFYKPRVGDSTNNERKVAARTDQNISDITIYTAEYGSQYKSILLEKVPPIIITKCIKYMQNETFANGENMRCPRIYLVGSFSQPNIAANTHK
jgi:hypothetical protein